MRNRKVLVREGFRAVDACAAGAIAVQEVAALQHEVFDDAVELGAFVALGAAQVVLRLAGAELAEVLGGLGDGVGEEFDFEAAEGFAWGRV